MGAVATKCQCDPDSRFCERRQCKMPRHHMAGCANGHMELMDRLYEGFDKKLKQSQKRHQQQEEEARKAESLKFVSDVGDNLKVIIEREIGEQTCSRCRQRIQNLNRRSPDDVLADLNRVATDILRDLSWPDSPRDRKEMIRKVSEWVSEACGKPVPQREKPVRESRHPNFIARIAVAMRVSGRADSSYWKSTRDSALQAGFPDPVVFAEPDSPEDAVDHAEVVWSMQMGPIGSFKAMTDWMLEHTTEEWLLLLEDDVLLSDGTADYLRQFNLTNEILSLYVSGKRQLPAPGFSTTTQPLAGSLAIVIRRGVLQQMARTRQWRRWPKHDCVDQLIHRAAAEIGSPVQTHNPSLAQHIGETASIYPDRTLQAAIRHAADWTGSGPWKPPLVTLITPTGDRPESFARCEEWISRQRYTGDIQWIIVDEGEQQTIPTMGQIYIRREPMRQHSLCRNIRAALPQIKGDFILVIEDDDWYAEDYVSTMVGRLQRANLVGEFGAKYYYIRHGKWRHNHDRENHASLCRTGFTRAVLPLLNRCVSSTNHPSIDLRLWGRWTGSTYSWRDPDGVCNLCVGIKGVSGRQSRGWRPSRSAKEDDDGEILSKWVGEDAIRFADFRVGASAADLLHFTSQ